MLRPNNLWTKQIFKEFALERLRENSAGSCPIDGRETSHASQQIIRYNLGKEREKIN